MTIVLLPQRRGREFVFSRKQEEPTTMKYRRRIKSDVWHFHPLCQHWQVLAGVEFIEKHSKPKSYEFCNECRGREKADQRARKWR